jgi:translation elongation factor EF-4
MMELTDHGKQYAGVFPVDSNDFPKLEESIKRVSAKMLGK